MPFDVNAAKAAGYSDAEIQQYIGQPAQPQNFDVAGARAAGYSDAEIQQHLGRQGTSPQAEPTYDPTEGMSTTERVLAGVGGGMVDVALGAKQMLAKTGLFDEAKVQAEVDEKRRLDAPLAATTAGGIGQVGGRIAATLPLAVLAPGGIAAAAATGAGTAAFDPVATGESRLANMATGAVGGAAGGALLKGAARLLSPRASTNPAIQKLISEDVSLTPGRLLGPTAARFEDAATSTPFVGDIIKRAQNEGLREFDIAALNRVLAPLNQKLPASEGAGREALEGVVNRVSDAYDQLLPKMHVKADAAFMQDMIGLRSMANNMPAARMQQFDQIIDNHLLSRFTDGGLMNGASLKQAQSELGRVAKDYMSSSTADERILGTAIKETQNVLRSAITRSNPTHAPELAAIDQAYAQLARVENASLRASGAAEPGVFSPAQLLAALKAKDTSFGKRQFNVKGQAPMQDLAEAGTLLRSVEPNSGTPYRMMVEGALMGGATALNPALIAGLPLAGGVYSRAGRKALTALMARRPQDAQRIAEGLLRYGSPAAATLGAQQAVTP
jgi:hypothetical protein